MHIKTACPQCESTYQVDPGLKGKRMRCPNPICRAIFEVKDVAEAAPSPPPPPAPRPPQPAILGGMVPVVPASAAVEQEPLLDDFFSGVSPVSQVGPQIATTEGPSFAALEEAPPVRQGLNGSVSTAQVDGVSTVPGYGAADLAAGESQHRVRRWPWALLGGLAVAAACVAVWLVTFPAPSDEGERFAKAEKEYQDHNFADAAGLFQLLVRDFPESDKRPTYQFLAELSDIRNAIHRTQTDVEETLGHLDRLRKFVEVYEMGPHMKEHKDEVAESLYRLVEEMTGFAAKEKNRNVLETARRLNAEAAKKFKPAPLAQAREIDAALDSAEQVVMKDETRQRVLAQLKEFNMAPSLAAVEKAPLLVRQAGLGEDAEIKALIDSLPAQHRKRVQFDADLANECSLAVVLDSPPSLAVLPYRKLTYSAAAPGSRPVFGLVHGVLYAVDAATGSFQWARRVGVDSTVLPLWVPGTAVAPPMVLVSATKPCGLLALDGHDGSLRWCQELPEPGTGQPLLVGNRILVACPSGTVFEIDVASGRRLGGYQLGEELTHGGVLQPGTNIVCFAANRGCIFVLDVGQRQCASILYTGHPSGSLRCPPVVLPVHRGEVIDPAKVGPSQAQLLLCQDDGQRGTSLLGYALPIAAPHAAATTLGDKLPGRMWYPPFYHPEHISLVTDAGTFAAFGLRQRDNRDSELFPMLRTPLPGPATAATSDRPLAAFADGQNFWVLGQGRLYHFQARMSPQDGWRIVPRPLPLDPLGSALQAAQVHVDDRGHTSLFLVTESPSGRGTWMTAVDLDRQTVRWQRQIGVVPQGSPMTLDDKVLAWDRAGEFLLFDPAKSVASADSLWQLGGKVLEREQPGSAWLLPHADTKTVFVLAVQDGVRVKVWKYRDGVATAVGAAQKLEAPLAGTPALAGDALLLPLANGRLARIAAGTLIAEGDWRSPRADKDARGHLVAIGAGKLAGTDGSQGLTLWRLDGQGLARLTTVKVKNRIIARPAVLTGAGQLGAYYLAIADVGRIVTLLQGDELTHVREWTMSDTVTAGPCARGDSLVVIVGGRRLVCLDPHSDKPRWAISFRGDIVGEPQLIDGTLIVADESGQIQALDLATGRFVGAGYTLRADVAPAATPLPYSPDRLFVPLTDGTVLLPARTLFR